LGWCRPPAIRGVELAPGKNRWGMGTTKKARTLQSALRVGRASLRVKLLGLVFLAMVPMLGLLLLMASDQRQRAQARVQDDALRLARTAAANEAELVNGARYLLTAVAQLRAIRTHDPVACTPIFKNLLAQYPIYSNFGATDRDGNIVCMGLPFQPPINMGDRAVFQAAMRTRDFTVGEYEITRANALSILSFGYYPP
jgi:hypothetical protein